MTFSAWCRLAILTTLVGVVGCGGGSSGSGAGGGGAGGEGGDTELPAVAITDAKVKEGNFGTRELDFTVTLSHASADVAKVAYETLDDTAAADGIVDEGGQDYDAASATLRFDPGETEQVIHITINGDGLNEDDETFRVKLTKPIGATLANVYGVGTILNDDMAIGPAISIADLSVNEGSAGTKSAMLSVTLSDVSDKPVSVSYTTADGTAVAGEDYSAASGTLTFAPGETEKFVPVPVLGDVMAEADETLSVALTNPKGGSVATPKGTLTIINDDASGPTLTLNDASVSEGNAGTRLLTFTVTLSLPSATAVTVSCATADGTASSSGLSATGGLDYVATSDSLTFAPGETSKQVTITVYGDTLNEADETFTLELFDGVGALVFDPVGIGTITNDDVLPGLSIADSSVVEGAAGARVESFTVSLSQASGQQVSVSFATVDGSATAGVDYTATSGKLTFAPGQTTASVSVLVAGDVLDEADETFSVTLSDALNANVNDSLGQGKIVDDDDLPTLAIGDVSIVEGSSGTKNAVFAVTLSAVSGRDVTVSWSTNDLVAAAGQDYVAGSGFLDFPAGTTSRNVLVAIQGDLVDEPNESFTVDLSNPSDALISDGQGVGTIITDDSTLPGLNIQDANIDEGNAGTATLKLTVLLSAVSAQQVKVNYKTLDDQATAGSDYQSTTGTLTFAPGEVTKTVDIPVSGDTLDELDETLFVSLSGAINAFVADGVGVGVILNDDVEPTLSVNDVVIVEGNTLQKNATFTISLSVASGLPVSVSYATSDGTAVEAGAASAGQDDYEASSDIVIIAAGATSAQVSVLINGDKVPEISETFGLGLSAPQNATIADGVGQCTITNDDALPSMAINDVAALEGDAGTKVFTFTVTLSSASGNPVSVDYATANGTAQSGSDYDAASGTIMFSPGQTTATIDVTVRGDTAIEAHKDESFVVNLSNPTAATVSDAQGTGTIQSDD